MFEEKSYFKTVLLFFNSYYKNWTKSVTIINYVISTYLYIKITNSITATVLHNSLPQQLAIDTKIL